MRICWIRKITIISCVFCLLFCASFVSVKADNSGDYVYLGGNIIGFELKPDGALIAEVCGVQTEYGTINCCEGLMTGDVICKINDFKIGGAEDVTRALRESVGSVKICVVRAGKTINLDVFPAIEAITNQRKLGVMIKEGIDGLGTLTCYTDKGEFYALGHEVVDFISGNAIYGLTGRLKWARVLGVDKGKRGAPGSIKGVIENKTHGMVSGCGKFGITGSVIEDNVGGQRVKVASKQEVKVGNATICSEISGERKCYDVKIVKIANRGDNSDKNLIISVVDKALINLSGGIVQGMSGSPILQNGMLIGAVTHVFLNDPTKGYGVFAENMMSR